MANRGTRGGAKRPANPEGDARAREWFAHSNNDQKSVKHWEVGGRYFQDAIFGLLGDGIGVMFTRGSGGSAVGIVIMQGEKPWPREYFHEAAELEEGLRRIADRTSRGSGNPLDN